MTETQLRVGYLVSRAGLQMLEREGDPEQDVRKARGLMDHFAAELQRRSLPLPDDNPRASSETARH